MEKKTKVAVTKTKYYAKGNDWYEVILPERRFVDTMGIERIYPAICRTTDYAKLEDLQGQRKTTASHVKKLVESVTELNSVNREVVVVKYNNHHTLGDGKHLFLTLVQLGLPVEFKLIDVSNLKDAVAVMRKMNSTSRNWTIHQFVNSTAVINKDYAKLQRYYSDTNITINLLGALMYNTKKLKVGNSNMAIKNGTFQMNTSASEMALFIKRIKKFYAVTNLDDNQYCSLGLCCFIIEKAHTYSAKEKKFLNVVKEIANKRKYTNKSFGRKKEYIDFFAECWNDL